MEKIANTFSTVIEELQLEFFFKLSKNKILKVTKELKFILEKRPSYTQLYIQRNTQLKIHNNID